MQLVELAVEGRVAILRLNDPARRNALTLDSCAAIGAALDEAEANPDVGALIITGTGRAFCAGADLSQLGASRREGLLTIYEGFLRVARSPLPTIAAVNGAAVGAGMNLALAADVRLASHSARFDTRFLDLGIHPGGGHTWMLRRAVGPQAAAAMVLFGEVLDGPEAERIGLVWRSVPDNKLLEVARTMAARAAATPAELRSRTKRTMSRMGTVPDHDEAVQLELDVQLWSMEQPEFAERLAALQRRITSRPPNSGTSAGGVS